MTDLNEKAPDRFRVTTSDSREGFQTTLNINSGKGWTLLQVATTYDTVQSAVIHTAVWELPEK